MPAKHDSLIERVKAYTGRMSDLPIIELAALSPDAVGVFHGRHDWSTYFDKSKYEVINPGIWGDGCMELFPPGLNATGLGILTAPQVNSFQFAMELAKSELKPKDRSADWYSKPVEIKS